MLLVKTKLGISRVHGIGLFAAQFIPQGTVTWEYHPEFDTAYDEADIARMSSASGEQFMKYAYFDKELNRFVLCCDEMRHINHCAQSPNITA
ncbi:MAG: SET domain-containing protein, partial [Acidobacteriota bacterium]|nr:SET domain-containing protein [Acidobacteriota bacterium]